jgi:ribosome-associated protein
VRLAPGVRVRAAALRFSAERSAGPGGQNVNKRSTRVQLRVAIDDLGLPADARARLVRLAGSLVTGTGELIIASGTTRSQTRNRADTVERLSDLVRRALVRPKVRRPTKPTKGSIRRRITSKKHRGELKSRRRPPKSEDG